MKKLMTATTWALLLTAAPAFAQGPRGVERVDAGPPKARVADSEKVPGTNGMSMSEMTPEMWLYTQESRRHDDPKEAVRRKAEFRTAQRQRRMAAREWFGYSNARPTVNPDPWNAGYSAHWSANNAMRPYQWIGNSRTAYRR